jgi:hypothetical protein
VRTYYDLEFLEDGRTIEPISIGMVREDGRELYLINEDAPLYRIMEHPWLMDNVVPHLPVAIHQGKAGRRWPTWDGSHPDAVLLAPHAEIGRLVREFIGGEDRDDNELWAWYGAYDHVALCQLWGRMIDLPPNVPMFTHDLKQLVGNARVPEQPTGLHNALEDARHNAFVHRWWEAQNQRLNLVETWRGLTPAEQEYIVSAAHGTGMADLLAKISA